MDSRDHWDDVYRDKGDAGVSWYQPKAELSLQMIAAVSAREAAIIDVGGGASTLVDGLLEAGYRDLTVLDWSGVALELPRKRLGTLAANVKWWGGDVLTARLPRSAYNVWHDRAVFHFLTTALDRERYVGQVRRAVKPGGHVLVATFAEDGPQACSGLPVARYSPGALHSEFGADFILEKSERQRHVTPAGVLQAFTYCLCRYLPHGASSSMRSAA